VTRAVLDPGVLIAGIISPDGSPASLLRSWRLGEFDLVACPMLVAELGRALGYPRLRRFISEPESARLLDRIMLRAVVVDDPDVVPSVCRDPNDDYLFAVAQGHADVLVSGDKDVLEAEDVEVRVLTPAAFREILRTRWD
jgi:uncharacterized protein